MAVLCSNCSGKLIFNPASQKLECVSCGSKFYPEDVEDSSTTLHSKYYSTCVYTCSHCGAEVITSDTEASTFCVYCGNPAIVFSRMSEEFRPDGIIPFKITKEQAISFINARFLKNPFVPAEVKAKLTPDNIRGIYIPYWVVNADYTEADIFSGDVKRGKNSVKVFFSRAGDTEFQNLPIDGSKLLSDDISFRLEPFYLEEAKAFDEDYLNGFYSNISDLTYIDLKNSAADRCHRLFTEDAMKTIRAKNVKLEDSIRWIDIHEDPIYMLMPVWFFTFRYKDKPYTILVNGQLGKVVGTMPWNKKSIVGIGTGVCFAVLLLTGLCFARLLTPRLGGLYSMYSYVASVTMAVSVTLFATGLAGLRKIRRNLRLTQSEDMFKFVKRRQE